MSLSFLQVVVDPRRPAARALDGRAVIAVMARGSARAVVVLALAVIAGVVTGCSEPLLVPNEERSQYDRFDAVRNQRAAPYLEDEFGQRRPNLRGRLLAQD